MRVIANRALHGEYGTVTQDQEFECREETGMALLKKGLARTAVPPKVEYEKKVIKPEAPAVKPEAAEAGPRQPFRDVPVSDAKQERLAPEGDRLLPLSDLPADGTTDPRGRPGRSRPSSGR